MNEALIKVIQTGSLNYAREKLFSLPPDFIPDLVVTKDPAHGDLATNIAFKIAKLVNKKPFETAQEFIPFLQKAAAEAGPVVEKMQIAGPGFINFYLNKNSFGQVLLDVQKLDKNYGHSAFGKNKKVLLEFVSANPTGPLTIAHGRQAIVGDTLARILRVTGHEVQCEYYLNDAGRQMNLLGASLWSRYQQVLGKDAPLPEEGYQGEYLLEVARELQREKGDTLLKQDAKLSVDFCRKFAGDTIMKGILEDLTSVDVKFDSYFNETWLYEKDEVRATLDFLQKKGHLYEHDGALWFRSTAFGDDKDRVVKKSTGEYTYLAPDIAYHRKKFDRGFNWLVNFLGPDHHGYITRLKAACQALGHDAGQIEVRIVQLTTLYRKGEPVRMSTRAGEFITLRELVQEVGSDASRCFFVMRKIESHLDFDLELAKEKSQENPVFYLQYGHARIASLLKFSERKVNLSADPGLLASDEEKDLIKRISEYSKVLIKASETLEPYRLADYLRELSASFHKFYSHHRIVTDDAALSEARLLLADCARITLRNGLSLLGISQPESM